MVDMQCPCISEFTGKHSLQLSLKVDHVGVQHRLILYSSHVLSQRIDHYIVEDRLILWPTGDEDAQVAWSAGCTFLQQAFVESVGANRMVRQESPTLNCLFSGRSVQTGFSRIGRRKEETCTQISRLTIMLAIVVFPIPAIPLS